MCPLSLVVSNVFKFWGERESPKIKEITKLQNIYYQQNYLYGGLHKNIAKEMENIKKIKDSNINSVNL